MSQASISHFFLRAGLAFVFLYAAIGSWTKPDNWIGYFPEWMFSLVPQQLLLTGFSLIEAVLAIWILSGKAPRIAGGIATLLLLGIVVFNSAQFDILFRDIGLALSSLSYALSQQKNSNRL